MVSSFSNQSSLFRSYASLHFTLYTSHIERPFFPSYYATGIQESKKHHFAKGDAFFQITALTCNMNNKFLRWVGYLLWQSCICVLILVVGGGDVQRELRIRKEYARCYIYRSSRWSKQKYYPNGGHWLFPCFMYANGWELASRNIKDLYVLAWPHHALTLYSGRVVELRSQYFFWTTICTCVFYSP